MTLNMEVRLLARLGRADEAARRRVELLAAADVILRATPDVPFVRRTAATHRAAALVERARAGDVPDLGRQADDLLAADPQSAGMRYNVACALAAGSRHAHPFDRDRWAARAVGLLAGLLDGPFYRGPTDAPHVDADPDLDPLRDRPDFRAFRAELGKRFPPAAPPPRPKPET